MRKITITPEELKEKFDAYLTKCENHTIKTLNKSNEEVDKPHRKIPTIKDFWCVFMKKSWGQWNKLMENAEYKETCQTIKDTSEGLILDALINREGNSTGLIFDLKSNYGYTDKQITDEHLKIRRIEINVRRDNKD